MLNEPAALVPVLRQNALRVRQSKDWGEFFTGLEGRNQYQVMDADGHPLLLAGEVGGGLGAFLLRNWLKAKRPFTLELKTPSGALVLRCKRPWTFWFARMEVEDGEGRLLGTLRQRFRLFGRAYDVEGPGGEWLATLRGPLFRPWTFLVERDGRELCRISKQWSGLGVEMFTHADNFGVRFDSALQDSRLRALLLAATFLIDFVHFEHEEHKKHD